MSRLLTQRRTVIWLLACALAVRLGALLALRPVVDFETAGVIHGSVAYDKYARNLISTGVYGLTPGVADAVLPPVYSTLLAAVYRTAGRAALPIVLLNTAFDLLALLAIRQLGTRLFPSGRAVGTLAAVCTAFYPYLVFQSLTIVDTSVFIGLLYLFLAMVTRLRDVTDSSAMRKQGLVCGMVLGLATLTRPVTPPLAALVALWMTLNVGLRPALHRLVPVALGATLVVAPWIARNTRTFGTFVAVTTNGGSNFWQGNNADTLSYLRAGYDAQWISPPPIAAADPLGPEADAQLFRHAIAFLSSHPAQIPSLVWTKIRVQWSIDVAPHANPSPEGPRAAAAGAVTRFDGNGGTVRLGGLPPNDAVVTYSRPLFDRVGRSLHRLYWGSLLLFGVLGSLLTLRKWRDVSLLWFLAIALTSVYVVTHPSTRYRVPGDPAWFLFSSTAFLALASLWPRGSKPVAERPSTLGPAVCWVGSARYAQPLDLTTSRKWRALADLQFPMHVVAFSNDPWPRHFTEHATFHLIPTLPFSLLRQVAWLAAAPVVLFIVALRREARIFVAQSPIEGAVAALVKVLLARLGRPVALIVETHGDFQSAIFLYRRVRFASIVGAVRRRIAAFALRHADLGRAVSAATRLQLQRSAPFLPIEICPPWIDVEAFASIDRTSPPTASRDVLFVGGFVPIKGLHVLLEAFARVLPHLETARLIVVGPASARSYAAAFRARVAELNLDGSIQVLGERNASEIAGLMAKARVVVVPSLSEGLSRVALEAMLVGAPVIASRVGGLAEVVRDGETGWLVPPDNPEALATALITAFDSRDLDALSARARAHARQSVTIDTFVEGHRRLFAAAGLRPARAAGHGAAF